jgi:CRISPR/Cas system-associated endoribonuclease Cas2
MKKFVIVVLLLAGFSEIHAGPRRLQRALRPNAGARANGAPRPNAVQRRTVVEEAVLGFYVNQFQESVQAGEITTELFQKILPFIQQFVQDRFEISQRRTRALNQMRQALARNAGEDEVKRWVRDLDAADSEFQSNQEKFFSSVDPLLNPRQQARIRIVQNMADVRIRQVLNTIQNPPKQGGVPQNPD